MDASKITVRLDAEQRTAEVEIMIAHSRPRVEGLSEALGRLGVRPLCTVEMSTPRYRITRSRFSESDGSTLSGARVLQILNAARNLQFENALQLRRTRRMTTGE
jgi:hypothetical protein